MRDRSDRRFVGRPEPGFFRLKLTKGGVFVAARISYGPPDDPETGEPLDRSWMWRGEIDGRPDPNPAPSPTDAVWRIWHSADRIAEAEYRYLLARSSWAHRHDPLSAESNPRSPVDFLQASLPF